MIRLLAVLLAALAGCGPRPRLALAPPAPLPETRPGPQSGNDEPDEAQRYYFMKRTPGGGELPMERYFEAQRHIQGMRVAGRARSGAKPDGRREAAIGAWEDLGPGNFGGRTRSLVINPADPNIMYAGAVLGGVWKTTDGGANWAPLNDLLPNIGIGALAMDPKNPNILFAGTGEWFSGGGGRRGAGIFRTADGGASWTLLESTTTTSFYYTNKIAISPADSRRIYAATYGGVWRSLDSGETWTRVLVRTSPDLGCQDMVMRSDKATDYLLAACQGAADTTIFRNTDAAGQGTWQPVFTTANMRRTTLALAPSNQDTVYAMAASGEAGDFSGGLLGVWRSPSGGDPDSWEKRTDNKDPVRQNTGLLSNSQGFYADICSPGAARSFSNQGGYDNVLAVDPAHPDIVWAGGIDLFRSGDGGRTWAQASYWNAVRTFRTYVHADQHVLVFHPQYNGDTNQVLFNANDGGLFKTENARAPAAAGERAACSPANSEINWTSLNNNYNAAQFYHGVVYEGGLSYFGGNQDLGTLRGYDATGRQNWNSLIGGDGGQAAIDPANTNRIYGETQRNTARTWFRRSLNGGASFQAAMNGITDAGTGARFLFITPYVVDPADSRRLWLGGKILWRTTDGADKWEAAASEFADGITSAIAIAPGNPDRVLAGTSAGSIYRSDAALSSLADTEWLAAKPRAGYVSSLNFDPKNPNVAYATYSTFNSTGNTGHVFKSDDGGVTWRSIDGEGSSGLPDLPAQTLAVHPGDSNTLYVGTDLSVFVSADGGSTWARDDVSFPNTVAERLQFVNNNGPVLYAFTYGRGLWRTRLSDQPPCEYKASATASAATAFGGALRVSVETGDGCPWNATSNSTAAVFDSPAAGAGTGDIALTVAANTTTLARSMRLTVANKTLDVQQDRPVFPANNDAAARPFPVQPLPFVGVQDTRTATSAADDPEHTCTRSKDSKTVWYSVRPDFTGKLAIALTGTRYDNGQTYNPVLSVHAGGAELACVAAAGAAADVDVIEGTTYLIEASGRGDASVGGYTVLTVSRKR